jgi:uncharacterized Fe-S center protein
MKSEVFLTRFGAANLEDSILARLTKLFDRVGAGGIIKENDVVAVKGHFGEEGNVSFIPPIFYRTIIDRIKICGGQPFVSDTNTLYVGERNNAVKHLNLALRHGFSYATINAPVLIADGLTGMDFVEEEINLKHVKKAKVASAYYWANTMVVISHCKGHMITSLGGAIKNIGMGCAPRPGKQEQHSGSTPKFKSKHCIGCGECVKWCNYQAIRIENKKAVNDKSKCVGCGKCIAACRYNAIDTFWDSDVEKMNEKMAEYAFAVMKSKKDKIVFFNFLMNVTPECDCTPSSDRYLVPDIGILASFDPVAIDHASVELINSVSVINENIKDKKEYNLDYAKTDKFKMAHSNLNWKTQLKYGQEIGLGNMDYELIEVK